MAEDEIHYFWPFSTLRVVPKNLERGSKVKLIVLAKGGNFHYLVLKSNI